jgi:hypothetical protein
VRRKVTSIVLLGLCVGLVASAALAAPAAASPAWIFESTELSGSETIEGDAILSSLAIPGLTTTCKKMTYAMTISNVAKVGQGEVTGLSFKTCTTSSPACSVKTIAAEKLPWASHLATVGSNHYVVVEGIRIGILYAGEECALGETLVIVKGSVGGLYENPTETFTFNATNSKAVGAKLTALSQTIGWTGAFTTEATGGRKGQALTVF